MASGKEIALEHVIPALGAALSIVMFLSTGGSILQIRRTGRLEDLNPLPYPAMFANCAGWVGYAFVLSNFYILIPNYVGVCVSFVFLVISASASPPRMRDLLALSMLFFAVVILSAGVVSVFAKLDKDTLQKLWGYTTVAMLVIYYAAPLSMALHVIRSRCSASLHPWLVALNCANGTLWTVYGAAVGDAFIYGPNATGVAFSLFLGILLFIFPRQHVPPLDVVADIGDDKALDSSPVSITHAGEPDAGSFTDIGAPPELELRRECSSAELHRRLSCRC